MVVVLLVLLVLVGGMGGCYGTILVVTLTFHRNFVAGTLWDTKTPKTTTPHQHDTGMHMAPNPRVRK